MKVKLSLIIIISIIVIGGVLGITINWKSSTKKNVNKELEHYTIPKMYITGDIEGMQEKEDKREIKIKYESNGINFESFALLKVQGNYTLKFDKKNYNITFYKDSEFKEKQEYDVKWGEYNKYTLKANWTDPLHSGNIVTAQISSQINQKYGILTNSVNNGCIDGFPIEIYANDEFLGLYTMNLHKDNIFKMDEENENNIVIFGNTPQPTAFQELETEEWNNYEVEFGEANEQTLNKLNRLINFIKNSSDKEFVDDFEKYFNVDSVLNYYCLMKYAHLIDNVTRNIFLVTYDGEVWYMISYDFDNSWGNEFNESSIITDHVNKHTTYYINKSPLWKRFEKLFAEEIKERYKELRKEILTKENVTNKMNEFYKLIPEETLKKEYEKWNNKPDYERTYLNDYLEKLENSLDKKLGM